VNRNPLIVTCPCGASKCSSSEWPIHSGSLIIADSDVCLVSNVHFVLSCWLKERPSLNYTHLFYLLTFSIVKLDLKAELSLKAYPLELLYCVRESLIVIRVTIVLLSPFVNVVC